MHFLHPVEYLCQSDSSSSVLVFICFHLILEEYMLVPLESNKPYMSSVYNIPKQTCEVLAGPRLGAYVESQPRAYWQ